jgi:hypothetical protein
LKAAKIQFPEDLYNLKENKTVAASVKLRTIDRKCLNLMLAIYTLGWKKV